MAHLLTTNPAYQLLSAKIPAAWKRPRGRPRATWLQEINGYYQELGIGRERAWGLVKRDPEGWHLRVTAATHCLSVCSHT